MSAYRLAYPHLKKPAMFQQMLRFGTVVLLAALTLSCLDQIELDQGANLEDGIALSGRMRVFDGRADVSFRGGRLFRFNSNRSERLINASVVLELSNGTDHPLSYNRLEDVFTVVFPLPDSGLDTMRARVRVITVEGDGYLSDWDPIPEDFVPDALIPTQVFDADGQPVSMTYELNTPARRADGSGTPFLYRYSQSYRVLSAFEPIRFCYFEEPLRQTDITLFDPKADYSGDFRTINVYNDEIDWQYAEGFYLNVTQDPISDAAHDYFSKFLSFVDRDRSIFEAPPGDLPGNFRSLTDPEQERIYGLFYVTRPRTVRVGIPAGDVSVTPFCVPIGNYSNNRCGDCGRAGGSLGRPFYWTF